MLYVSSIDTPTFRPARSGISGNSTRVPTETIIPGILAAFAAYAIPHYRQKKKLRKLITDLEATLADRNTSLKNAAMEHDWLTNEVQHRVRNNLQLVISLLQLQSTHLTTPQARVAHRNTYYRILALSLIYHQVYQDNRVSEINIVSYIHELIRGLSGEYNDHGRISFALDLQPLCLDISRAEPLGLIINEAVVNSLRFAFPGGRRGIIRISLQPDGKEHVKMLIRDDGVGLPASNSRYGENTAGLALIRGLSTQLGGALNITNENGVTVSIHFDTRHQHPEKKLIKSHR